MNKDTTVKTINYPSTPKLFLNLPGHAYNKKKSSIPKDLLLF